MAEEKRTVTIELSNPELAVLNRLPTAKGQTTEEYTSEIIEQAVKDGSLFEFVRNREKKKPSLPS